MTVWLQQMGVLRAEQERGLLLARHRRCASLLRAKARALGSSAQRHHSRRRTQSSACPVRSRCSCRWDGRARCRPRRRQQRRSDRQRAPRHGQDWRLSHASGDGWAAAPRSASLAQPWSRCMVVLNQMLRGCWKRSKQGRDTEHAGLGRCAEYVMRAGVAAASEGMVSGEWSAVAVVARGVKG